jgi:hypothetical protein
VLTLVSETSLREPPSRRGSRRGSRRNPGTLVAFYSDDYEEEDEDEHFEDVKE